MDGVELDTESVLEVLRNYLNPSESLKAAVVAQTLIKGEDISNEYASLPGPLSSNKRTRILAVVSNVEQDSEEGCVFIFKTTPPYDLSALVSFDLLLLSVHPLFGEFAISIAQARSPQHGSQTSGSIQTLMTITINANGQKLTFLAPSTDSLRVFVAECRRLKKLADANYVPHFRWVDEYDLHVAPQRTVPPLFPRPDLRSLRIPAHERLSPAFAGDPGEEDADTSLICNDWIRRKLEETENTYAEGRHIRIRVGTFNVNGRLPSQDLSPWVRPRRSVKSLPPHKPISPLEVPSLDTLDLNADERSETKANTLASTAFDETDDADLLVFGFQELDLSTEALLYSYTTTREEAWLAAIYAGLGEVRDKYTKLASKQLVGMLIILIVKKDLLPHFSDIVVCTVGRGIMGVMGNKGAAAIRVKFDSTVLAFVNSHLAAYDDFVERRNEDYHDLARRLLFDCTPAAARGESGGNVLEEALTLENAFLSDYLFWMGGKLSVLLLTGVCQPSIDLNYRIDLPDLDVRELVAGQTTEANVRDMLEHDQLVKAVNARRAFEGFREGQITFLPSYRFNPDSFSDRFGYDSKRRPAWTDRILYTAARWRQILQRTYEMHPEISMSDHRPVSAVFDVEVRSVDEGKYRKHAETLLEQLGELEDSEELPRIHLRKTAIDFGNARYDRPETRTLQLENRGTITAAFRLVSKEDATSSVPSWLTITPRMGIILPGETVTLTFTVLVDKAIASTLNLGARQLEDVAILHTEHGKDHFVTVSAQYLPSCFANELSTLVRLPGPIRSLKPPLSILDEHPANAPREVMRLISWLMTEAVDVPGLFLRQGSPEVLDYVRECLDTGDEFVFSPTLIREVIALSVADTLVKLLESLPTPVIPAPIHPRCDLVTSQEEAFSVISELPGPSLNVWISLTALLHYLVRKGIDAGTSQANHSPAQALAAHFARILMRDPTTGPGLLSPQAKRRFVLFFIQ